MRLPPGAVPVAAGTPLPLASARAMADPAVEQAIAYLLGTAAEKRPTLQASAAQQPGPALREPPRVSRGDHGWLRSVGAPPGQAYSLPPLTGHELPGERAARFITEHAVAFGVTRPGVELRAERVKVRGERQYVRLEQRFEGLKVFAASVVVQLADEGGVEFVLADIARDDAAFHGAGFETLPKVGADAARALALTTPKYAALVKDLQATEPELMIYEPPVIGEAGPSRLVWHIEVTSRELPINEFVLVDAQTAEVALHFSQVMEALNRAILDCEGDPSSSCPLARFEGDPASAVDDVNKAYDFIGDAYDFYAGLGRDSVDDAGQQLVVYVRYCTDYECPMYNGYWSPQDEAIFLGENVAKASDFVAHEYTHGVTQHESDLIYWGESGAISESLSDIFGESVDLTDGRGDDTPESRWYVFEDWPTIGADRYMKDPTSPPNPCWPSTSCAAGQHLRQPDRRLSTYWFTDAADQRGVHANAGVGNKLAYLLSDGDSFNSWTVSGMGIEAMTTLFYEAQTNLLAPGSDYFDLYDHLKQAAINLSWTAAQRANLERACRAVEITYPGTPMTVTYQDFESPFPLTGWTVIDTSGVGAKWGQDPTWPANGDASAWCAADGSNAPGLGNFYLNGMNTWLIYGPFSLADVSRAWIELWLWSDTEPVLDYFYFGVSPDGSSITGNFISGWTNGWTRELLDFNSIGGIVGDAEVWVGLNFSSNPSNSEYYGTNIDDILIRKASCVSPSAPTISAPSSGTSGVSYDVTWSEASLLNTYEIQEATEPWFITATTYPVSGTSKSFTHTVGGSTTYYYRVRATDSCGGSTWSSAWSLTGETTVTVPSYTLTVSTSGGGTGTVTSSPTGISCGVDCSESYSGGTVVVLTATPDGSSAFAGWSGACSGSSSCQVTMSAARSVTAWFSSVTGCTTTVTDQAFTSGQQFQSCYSIVAGPNVSTTTAAGHLTLRAANRVVLRNYFSVGTGARLTVALDPTLAGT